MATNNKYNNRDLVKLFLDRDRNQEVFKMLSLCPAFTPLETVLEIFEQETEIPLQIPFISFMHLIGTYLLKNNVTVNVRGASIKPDLWTIVLAGSGSGKTFAYKRIEKACNQVLGFKAEFGAVASAKAFCDELKSHNQTLWFYDEFAQLLSQIEQPGSPLSQLKEYLLKTYDGDKIERITAKEKIEIENPCISMIGLNTPESFINKISEESFTDGFTQRFGFMLAEEDPSRPFESFDWYNEDVIIPTLVKAFEKIKEVSIHSEYVITDEAFQAYRKGFKHLLSENVSNSFYRRLMFRSFKYAVIYHIIQGNNSAEIEPEDIAWAMRVTRVHLSDLMQLLNMYGYSELEKKIQKVEQLYKKKGKELTPRIIVQYIRSIKTVNEAKQLLGLISEMEAKKNITVKPKSKKVTLLPDMPDSAWAYKNEAKPSSSVWQ